MAYTIGPANGGNIALFPQLDASPIYPKKIDYRYNPPCPPKGGFDQLRSSRPVITVMEQPEPAVKTDVVAS